jgi:hypothetical protein
VPSLLGEAEGRKMTQVNAKDKANQTPLSVWFAQFFVLHDQQSHIVLRVLQTPRCYHGFNGNDRGAFETPTGIAQGQTQHS